MKNETRSYRKSKTARPEEPSHELRNITQMVKGWTESIEKGNRGQRIICSYLIEQGYQASPILYYKDEQTSTTLKGYSKEEATIFSPDILAVNEHEIFFADAKLKTYTGSLGVINKTAYDSYRSTMQKLTGIGFRIYFAIEKPNKEIYLLEKLIDPKDFPEPYLESDGRLCYRIPKEHLKNLGSYTGAA